MVWPSLDSLSATTFSQPRMHWALKVIRFPGVSGQDRPYKGTQRAQPHASFLAYVRHHCGVLSCHKNYCVLTEVLELFQGQEDCFQFEIIYMQFAFWERTSSSCNVLI